MFKSYLVWCLYLFNAFIYLLKQPLSGDSLFTASLIRLPLKDMMNYIIGDFHPPLYYLLLSFFSGIFGFNDLVLRLFSIMCGFLSIWLFYKLIKEVFNANVAFFSSIILTFLPIFIMTSREPRMYSLLLLAVISTFFFYHRQQLKPALPNTLGLTLSIITMIYTHNWGLIVLLYLGIYTLASRQIKKYFLSYIIALVSYLPWVPIFLNQLNLKAELGRSWGLPINQFWSRLGGGMLWNYNILELPGIYWLVSALFVLISLIFLLFLNFRKQSQLLINLFLPFNLLFFYFLSFRDTFLTFPHLSYLIPFYALGLGKGINYFKNRYLAYLLLISFLLMMFSFNLFYHHLTPISQVRNAQLYVQKNQKESDVLVALTPYESLRMSWYLNKTPQEFIVLSPSDLPGFVMKDEKAGKAVNLLKEIKANNRAWVFYSGVNIYRKDRASIYDPQIIIKNWLDKNSELIIPFGENTSYPVYIYKLQSSN